MKILYNAPIQVATDAGGIVSSGREASIGAVGVRVVLHLPSTDWAHVNMVDETSSGSQVSKSPTDTEAPDEALVAEDNDTPAAASSDDRTTAYPTHDPRSVIEDLRNHLAAHDRCLSFLFGAGTSTAINVAPAPEPGNAPTHKPLIPAVLALTEICQKAVCAGGKAHAHAWTMLTTQCARNGQVVNDVNIEQILSAVRIKLDAIGDNDTLVGLDARELKKVETTICSTIAENVIPPESAIPARIPHDDFVEWVRRIHRAAPLEIFTTNYDILLERTFEHASVPVFDGFVGAHEPFFYAECLDDDDLLPKPKWIRLWKLHGSVNWKRAEVSGHKRIIRDRPSPTGEMILPSDRKYDESRKQPYIGYMDRLVRVLKEEHALLITCGYSFGDEDINAILYGALDSTPNANVIALCFEELNEAHPLVNAARQRSNLSIVAPNAGVISGIWGEWRLTRPVDKKTHAFMDTAFDSNAFPDDGGSPAAVTGDLSGKMRLGDFNWFSRFLREMSPNNE